MNTQTNDKTGAEDIHWDLTDLYNGIDDPALEQDRKLVCEKDETFAHSYKGEVADFDESQMKQALQDYEEIMELLGKIGSYAQLIWATDTGDEEDGKLVQDSRELSCEVNQQLVVVGVEWLQMEEEQSQGLIEGEDMAHS